MLPLLLEWLLPRLFRERLSHTKTTGLVVATAAAAAEPTVAALNCGS